MKKQHYISLKSFDRLLVSINPKMANVIEESDAEVELFDTLIKAFVKARIDKGITQEELAQKTGLTQSAIARFESYGALNPTFEFLTKLAIALDVRLAVIK